MAGCALLPQAARAQLTADDRAALTDLGPQFAVELRLIRGWYRGVPVRYYDIGPHSAIIAGALLRGAAGLSARR